jgi:tetratricopeptide (TPR) repeat protein
MSKEKKEKQAKEYFERGNAYYKQDEYDKAIADYTQAITLKPNYAEAYKNRGYAYDEKDEYDKAIGDFDDAIKLNDGADAYYGRGNAYFDKGEYDRAIEDFTKVIRSENDYTTRAYSLLAFIHHSKEEIDTAIETFDKNIKRNPKDVEVYNHFIYLFRNEKAHFDKVIHILERYKKAYFEIDIVYAMSRFEGIEDIINALLDSGYVTYFCQTINMDKKTEENQNEYDCYKKIYLSSIEIMQLLRVNNNEETENGFAHYTRKDIVEKLLIKSEEKSKKKNSGVCVIQSISRFMSLSKKENDKVEEKGSPFRLNSILTANDPTEGEIVFKYLGLENKEPNRDHQAFIACFAFDPECLNQFRLYGKEEGQEATGISLVFKKDFFAKKSAQIAPLYNKNDNKDKYSLYRCVYIDPKTKQIITLGHKDDYTFFRDKLKSKTELSPDEIKDINDKIDKYKYKKAKIISILQEVRDVPEKRTLSIDEIDVINNEINKYKKDEINSILQEVLDVFEQGRPLSTNEIKDRNDRINNYINYENDINSKLEEVRVKFEALKKHIEDAKKNTNIKEQIICDLLINLRYLIKHIAFKEEQECRIVQVEALANHAKVKLEGDKMFVETLPIREFIDKIYFAPNAAGMEIFQEKLIYDGLNIPCEQCKHPIRVPKS